MEKEEEFCRTISRKSKSSCFKNPIDINKSNKNDLWTIIREFFPKNSSNIPNYLKIDGKCPDNPNQASEMINNYFISITNLACYINNIVPLDSYLCVLEISKD